MVYSRRKRIQDNARREAQGEDLWRDEFDQRALTRLDGYWEIFANNGGYSPSKVASTLATMMRSKGGWEVSYPFRPGAFRQYRSQDALFHLDLLECVAQVLFEIYDRKRQFTRHVNEVLNEHRVAFSFVDGKVVPISSDELHVGVVEPTLRLLVGEKFNGAHAAYFKALTEIRNNDAGDAITDAGTALQETLMALGCRGNALGDLLKDAKSKGLLAGRDQAILDGVKKFGDWASGERNNGEAHRATEVELADAWLMVHVVGALIVRLTDPAKPRGVAESG